MLLLGALGISGALVASAIDVLFEFEVEFDGAVPTAIFKERLRALVAEEANPHVSKKTEKQPMTTGGAPDAVRTPTVGASTSPPGSTQARGWLR